MEIFIRKEQNTDFNEISMLHQSAFGRDAESTLVGKIRQGKNFVPSLSLVAIANHAVCGHILFSEIRIINGQGTAFTSLALAPMAVIPKMQRLGIGGLLIKEGLNEA